RGEWACLAAITVQSLSVSLPHCTFALPVNGFQFPAIRSQFIRVLPTRLALPGQPAAPRGGSGMPPAASAAPRVFGMRRPEAGLATAPAMRYLCTQVTVIGPGLGRTCSNQRRKATDFAVYPGAPRAAWGVRIVRSKGRAGGRRFARSSPAFSLFCAVLGWAF